MSGWGRASSGAFDSPGRHRSPRREAGQQPLFPLAAAPTMAAGMTQQEQQVTQTAVMSLDERVAKLEVNMTIADGALQNVDARLNEAKIADDRSMAEFGRLDSTIVGIVTETSKNQAELNNHKRDMEVRLSTAETTLNSLILTLRSRVDQHDQLFKQLEATMSQGGGKGSNFSSPAGTSFVPLKNMTPPKFGSKIETWREWQEDVRGYLDGAKPGIKEILQALENEEQEEGIEFVQQEYPHLASASAELWRTMKFFTEYGSDARSIVTGVADEDGFLAWSKLDKAYGLQLASKQTMIRAQFYALSARTKSPADTRSRLIEIDRMAKSVYQVTGKAITDDELKGVIAGCLDEVTCRHTTNLQGSKNTAKELRAVVNTFINTNVRESTAMQIGSLEAGEGKQEDEAEETFEGELHALKGKGKGTCYNCGGKGHIAANCPSPAQAKGGGKSAAGKGGKNWQKGNEYGKGEAKVERVP